ncbi:hypothetical protein GQ54DRAFT_294806 [Martensiomyces pterosporus]|nr:hypothetical protein GQ54DRAFT_294806 [Martensiomyces pterosporus]
MSSTRRLSSEPTRSRAPSLSGPAIGQAVEVQGSHGIVRFSGTTEFAPGRWFGIELEGPYGKNDGSVQGKRYFECQPNHGVFVRSSQVKILTTSSGVAGSASTSGIPPTAGRSRATIHGSDISGGADPASRLRTPAVAGIPPQGVDALRAARRSTALPGRVAPLALAPTASGGAAASAVLPPQSSLRLSGSLASRPSMGASNLPPTPTLGSAAGRQQGRRVSDIHGLASRRTTISGAKSPAPAGIRSNSRHSLISDGGSAGSRPGSREHLVHSRNETPSPSSLSIGESSDLNKTPTKGNSSARGAIPEFEPTSAGSDNTPSPREAPEAPRTPYRPALSMDESSAYDSTMPTATMSSQTVPLKQYEELRLKYKFLEQKRSEDRQRIQEADKIRSEAEQALRVRDKLAAKVGSQQDEVRVLKQRLKDIMEEREDFEAKYTEALDSMEMLAVDKEMAEEKTESLTQEVATLREQLDEASTSLDVYKQEGDHSAVLSAEPNAVTSLEYAQIQKQNDRLKEALVRLRDVTTENEAQLGQKIKQLEREAESAQGLLEESESLKEKLVVAESQIEDLKERLDDALGAEDIIEDLTERNLDLNKKVEDLQSLVENLEALCEVNNEMEETRAEEEQGLKAEIDRLNATVSDKNRRVDKLEEAIADYQFNMKQYRELVSSLQSELQRLREREQSQASEVASISTKTQEMMSLNLHLRSTMMKTKAKAIDLEMRRLEADQATEQLGMTEPFLPDHFFKSESEALRSLLAFKRLAAKGDILCKQLEQDEKTDANVSDEFVATAEIRGHLAQFSGTAGLFVSFLSTCSETEFMRLGSLLHDTQGTERRLNGLVDVLRKEEFRATEALPEIRRLTAHMQGLADSHIPAEGRTTAAQRFDILVSRLAFDSDIQLSNLFYIEQLLTSGPGTDDEEAPVSVFAGEDRQRIADEVLPSVASIIQHCKASKAVAIKLLRRSGELRGAGLAADSQLFEQASQLQQASKELGEYSIRVRATIQGYFAAAAAALSESAAADNDSAVETGGPAHAAAVSLARLQQDLGSITQDVFGASDATAMGLALGASQKLTKELGSVLALANGSEHTPKVELGEAPWVRRAMQFKASLVQNADVEKRTEALNEEIISLARELKLRDQAIQEYSVKTEMLEKRTETMKRQSEQVAQLQKLLDSAKAKEATYEEAIESLQSEVDGLEREHRKLKQSAAAAKSAAAAGDYSASGHGASGPLPTDLLGLRSKIETLQESVGYLRKENAHLRARYLYREESISLLSQPLVRAAQSPKSAEVAQAAREAKLIVKEACRLAAMPKLVRLAPTRTEDRAAPGQTPAWQPLRSRPQFDLYRQQTLAQSLKHRAELVQQRLQDITRYPALAASQIAPVVH